MCCTQLAGNTGRKSYTQNRHLCTIAQLCLAISSQLRHVWTIGKNLLNSNISSRCPHNMANLIGPCISGWNRSASLGTPENLNGFRVLASTVATLLNGRQPNFARCLAVSWACTLLPPNGILQRAKFTLRPSLALSYIGSVTARHLSSGREPNFAACYKEWN